MELCIRLCFNTFVDANADDASSIHLHYRGFEKLGTV